MADSAEKIRAFVAIHPPVEVVHAIADRVQMLRKELGTDGFRWAKTEQLHLTLQFLGYIPSDRANDFLAAVDRAASQHNTFELKTHSLGCFPSVSRPRVLWLGLSGKRDEVQQLKVDIDKQLVPLGYEPEQRAFHPHLTLARIAELRGRTRTLLKEQVAAHEHYTAGEFMVKTVELMQSVLSPKGAAYQVLGSFKLRP